MGYPGEALAWYRLALRAAPGDPDCRAALTRLRVSQQARTGRGALGRKE
jgi:hypothetical protein